MPVYQEEFEHPTQGSLLRVNIFEESAESPASRAPATTAVALGGGEPALAREAGFLLTEERIGTVTVVSSLGFFRTRDEAMNRLRRRADQLIQQRYKAVTQPAPVS